MGCMCVHVRVCGSSTIILAGFFFFPLCALISRGSPPPNHLFFFVHSKKSTQMGGGWLFFGSGLRHLDISLPLLYTCSKRCENGLMKRSRRHRGQKGQVVCGGFAPARGNLMSAHAQKPGRILYPGSAYSFIFNMFVFETGRQLAHMGLETPALNMAVRVNNNKTMEYMPFFVLNIRLRMLEIAGPDNDFFRIFTALHIQ
ncbi:hypothetical protein MPH_08248 [Macrophomina phaseolina MS6]|uniref:Uncharacterized protein n=1 Tax=Macrophomina phaseolina (strain MS6) TaxID=1126212 RepID=K2RP92_MACPH|nr:hypothetical protein MPH_08248 [Macrophomina phaseolina MS6]